MITIVFGLITVYHFYRQFGLIKYIIFYDTSGWDLSMVYLFLPIIMLPLATVLFWLRKKIGWILLSTYLIYSFINTLMITFMIWGSEPTGISTLDQLFPTYDPIAQLLALFFLGGSLWALRKSYIMDYFGINSSLKYSTYIISGSLSICLIILGM